MSPIIGRVVVGVDGSPGSLQALRFAVRHARALDAELIAVIAWVPPGGESPNRRYPAELAREMRDVAGKKLLTAFDEALGGRPGDLLVQCQVVRGRTGRVLVQIADQEGDLLVTGRGHGFAGRVANGSVSRYCLAHACCPAIAVPPPTPVGRVWRARWGLRLRGVPTEYADAAGPRNGGSGPAGHDSFAS